MTKRPTTLSRLAWAVAAGLAVAVAATGLSGCLKMGPDWTGPPQVVSVPAAFQHVGQGDSAFKPRDRWWESFGDPEINRLVAAALKYNLDIKEAAARVLEVGALFTQARSQRFPSLGLEGKATRSKSPESASPVPGVSLDTGPSNNYNLTLAASFELDLWGRLARADEAAKADLLAARENQRTVIQTVVASVVSTYLTMEATERRLQMAESALAAYRQSLAVVRGRYQRGLSSALAVRQANRALAVAHALIPSLRLELGKLQQDLAVLVGSYPKTSPARRHPTDYFHRPDPVPPGLPSQLLLRRPDVRAAVASLRALNARVGQAKAARFPTIRLTANWGAASGELSDLFSPASELWSLATGISAPIFNAGRLAAGQRAAEARRQKGAAAYAKKVLRAFAEVEGALLTRQERMAQRDLVAKALVEARATLEEAQSRYLRGLADYTTVLDAQKVRYQVEQDLILNELAVLTNRVTLHRVLGGGWDRSLVPAAANK